MLWARLRQALMSLCLGVLAAPLGAQASGEMSFQTYDVRPEVWQEVTQEWVEHLLATHPAGTWVPMKFEPTDAQLAKLGLPNRAFLTSQRFPVPTMVTPSGQKEEVVLPAVEEPLGTSIGPAYTTYAGTGCTGIRPGAWLLLLEDGGVGWCSMAHVYGSPGNYTVSTAGHCGKTGDVATVIAAFGNRDGVLNPVLLDFGTFSKSTGDGGIGKDWALIKVNPAYQHLVSPTMCAWGGPRGMYTKSGQIVTGDLSGRGSPVTINPDVGLAQFILHYGHGTGMGATGTPRIGFAQNWASTHFSFFGAIAPGDSGSGSNALSGDGVGTLNEAAGINTHLYVDPSLRTGTGFMAGTRATAVSATLANGQIVPYPVPFPAGP